jgi:hypothetical protein
MDISGTSTSSTTSNNNLIDLSLASTADKAVKTILPFFKELSEEKWWTDLLAAYINFEVKGPPKSVSSFLKISLVCSQLIYYSDSQITIVLVKSLYG